MWAHALQFAMEQRKMSKCREDRVGQECYGWQCVSLDLFFQRGPIRPNIANRMSFLPSRFGPLFGAVSGLRCYPHAFHFRPRHTFQCHSFWGSRHTVPPPQSHYYRQLFKIYDLLTKHFAPRRQDRAFDLLAMIQRSRSIFPAHTTNRSN